MLTNNEKKLIAILLRMASDDLSNRGANDFKLVEVMPDVNERRALAKKMEEENGTPEDYDEDRDYEIMMDWWLCSYFADVIEKLQ